VEVGREGAERTADMSEFADHGFGRVVGAWEVGVGIKWEMGGVSLQD
jgi:hypothetical protein